MLHSNSLSISLQYTVNQFTVQHKPEITLFDCNCFYFLLIYCMHSECEGSTYMDFQIKDTTFLFEKGTKNVCMYSKPEITHF